MEERSGGATSGPTAGLERWCSERPESIAQIFDLVYQDLRAIAERMMRSERSDHTLQPTAVVHEAFLRLEAHRSEMRWESRAHFLAFSARVMRRLLIDYARARGSQRRGGARREGVLVRIGDEEAEPVPVDVERDAEGMLDLDRALDRLAKKDPQKASIVEMRYFGGLTADEIAEALGISAVTVSREWRRAKGWLLMALSTGAEPYEAE